MSDSRYPATIHVDQTMIDKIDTPMDPAVVSSRPGGGNTTQSYIKGDIIADQLNAVFGPLGWSKASRIHSVDDWEEEKTVTRNNTPTKVNMHMVQVISDVTLTIKKTTADGTDTIFVEQGVGYGEVETGKSRKEAFGMAVKGASTDGLKRCSSLLGKAFGMMMASNGQQEDVQYAHNGKTNDLRKARELRARGGQQRQDDRGGDARGGQNRANAPQDARERGGQRADAHDRGGQDHGGQRGSGHDRGGPDRGGQNRGGQDGRDKEQEQHDRGSQDRGEGAERASRNQAAAPGDDRRQDARKGTDDRDDASQRQDPQTQTTPRAGAPEAGGSAKDRGTKEATSKEAVSKEAAPTEERRPATGRRKADTNYPLDNLPVTKDDQTDFAATLHARVHGMRQKADREGLVRQHLNTIRNLDGPIRKHLTTKLAEEAVDVDRL